MLGCPSAGLPAKSIPLYVPGELSKRQLAFRSPVLLYASRHNTGALEAAKALRKGMGDNIEVTADPSSIPGALRENTRRSGKNRYSASGAPSRSLQPMIARCARG